MNRTIETKNPTGKKLIIGLLLILAGMALIGNQFHIFPGRFRDVLFTWQTLLIIIGVIFVTTRESKVTGYILMFIGGFFLLPEIFNLPYGFRRLFWPVVLVTIGLAMIFGSTSVLRRSRNRQIGVEGSDTDFIDDVNIFGGHNRVITTGSFRGGSIVSIFGGGKYDFTRSQPSPDRNILEVTNIFGGSTLIVPPDWDVKVEVVAIFGGFNDKRKVENVSSGKQVIVKGIAVFGGGEILS